MSNFQRNMKEEMEAHRRIGSPGPAHVRGEKENKEFHKNLKKREIAKKMRPIGEDMHRTFKKLGTAVSKLGSTHKKYGDKPF